MFKFLNKKNLSWEDKYPNFSRQEMQCKCGCKGLPPERFMDKFQAMRTEAGFPFIVNSGYRCPEYNNIVSDSGLTGPHTLGAADVAIWGSRYVMFIYLAIVYGMTGIGSKQHGRIEDRFVHVDDVPEGNPKMPRIWGWTYK